MKPDHQLWVLLGGDYAGKSSLMTALAAQPGLGWQFVSPDDEFLSDDLWLGRRLRDDVEHNLPAVLGRYSADFVLTLIQGVLVFLRDEAVARHRGGPVLVDSYYYKFLAKCRLLGLINEDFFDWWRSFPRPDRVLYLDVPPAVAWQRSGGGGAVNPLETHDGTGGRATFEAFQAQLRGVLFEETKDVPVDVVDACRPIEATTREVAGMMGEARD